MYRIDLIIGLPLSGIDNYSEALRKRIQDAGESCYLLNSKNKNDGKVDLRTYSRLIIADPLLCNYRHLLISEVALTRVFQGVHITRTYVENDLAFIMRSNAWYDLSPEMKQNVITLSREYFPPEHVLKIIDILA